MRLVLFASGEFAIPTFRWLLNSPHEIVRVVTQPDRMGGRGRHPLPTPVRQMADERGLPVIAIDNVNAPTVLDELAGLNARLGLVIAFGQKLGPRLTASRLDEPAGPIAPVFPSGCVNLHASLLPRHRGAAPINYAILAGDGETGVTVFRLTQRMDGGSVLVTRRTGIKPEETADELHDRLAGVGVDAVQATFGLFEREAEPPGTPQPAEGVTRAPKLRKEDGYIDFARPARTVANHVCAVWSWPGAVCEYVSMAGHRERVTLARARPVELPGEPLAPGTLDRRLHVATQPGYVEVLEIKPASGRLMSWRDFVNGRHVAPGDVLWRIEPL